MRTRSRLGALAGAALLAASLTACGGEDPQGDTSVVETGVAGGSDLPDEASTPARAEEETEDETETEDATETETGDDDAAAGGTEIATAESDLGTILVDGEGRTLYLFTQDTQNSGESTCEGECLTAWPPLEGEATAGEGADDSLLGTIERPDGTVQATYNGWPLYYFQNDAAPGDTNGQGVNGVWWVVDPEGNAIEES